MVVRVKNGVEIERSAGETTLWFEPYVGGVVGKIGVTLTEEDVQRLVKALTHTGDSDAGS